MTFINPAEYDINKIVNAKKQVRKVGNQGTTSKRRYKDLITAFDIETTSLHSIKQSMMYVWQWQIEDETIIGRQWSQFYDLLERISDVLEEDEYIVIYCHNLSFEFQFLAGIFDFQTEDVFAIKKRRVLKASLFEHFEFRCSYLLSNLSLDKYLKEMSVESLKTTLDYKKIRYPWTELDEKEYEYIINDVKGLVQALKKHMSFNDDNLYTIPLTSTGFVRRDMKRAVRLIRRTVINRVLPDEKLFSMLKLAFRGGDTHANRYYSGIILKNVHSIDISSSYPSSLINYEYPMTKFSYIGSKTLEEVNDKIYNKHRALLMRVVFNNISLKDYKEGSPYIIISKCQIAADAVVDNGRVLSSSKIVTVVTDIDYKIINEQYDADNIEITDVYQASYGKLPLCIRELVLSYFKQKTELKNKKDSEFLYNKSKALLNSIYGLMAQDPYKDMIEFDFEDGDKFKSFKLNKTLLLSQLMQEAETKNRFILPYQWGVWTTAHARNALYEGRKLIGKEDFVYSDTDSIKFLGSYDDSRLMSYNEKMFSY